METIDFSKLLKADFRWIKPAWESYCKFDRKSGCGSFFHYAAWEQQPIANAERQTPNVERRTLNVER